MLGSTRGSIGVGRIAGIPLRVSYSVIVLAVAGAGGLAVELLPRLDPELDLRSRVVIAVTTVAAFLASILAHELGHALVAKRFDVGTESIRLWILGGVAALVRQAPTPKAEFWIAIAGPAVNTVVAIWIFGLSNLSVATESYPVLNTVGTILAMTNVLLAVSNMVPAAPLDGGRILTSILWWRNGDAEHARLTSARCGLVLGAAVVLFGVFELTQLGRFLGWYTLLIGAFLVLAARAEVIGAFLRGRLNKTRISDLMTTYPPTVADSVPVGHLLAPHMDGTIAYPVTRWNQNPVGYVTAGQTTHLSTAEASWTRVGQVMTSVDMAPRAWANESVDAVFKRLGEGNPLIVIHDPRTGFEFGTVSQAQLEPLLELPDHWGRERRGPANGLTDSRPQTPSSTEQPLVPS